MTRIALALALSLFAIMGCQTGPTQLHEEAPAQDRDRRPIEKGTIILDARPEFEYAMAHAAGALNVQWRDFAQDEKPFLGELELDLFPHARRLARMGIRPFTPVVVVGSGLKGHGEEGRLVWTLRVMGLSDVRYRTAESLAMPATREPPAPTPVPLWKPELDETLVVSREIFVKKVMQPVGPARPVVIDVRTDQEYLGHDPKSPYSKIAPDIGAINIPWTEFLNDFGSANKDLSAKLAAVGIQKDQQIYLIDNAGVRSAAATVALRDLGFSHAANFAGGYMELLAKGLKP